MAVGQRSLRPVRWVGSSRRDLRTFPKRVRPKIGFALCFAQLEAFGGGSVLEVVEDYDRATYRAVYTIRFAEAVYVLHVFQKKAKRGIATPKRELELIRARLQEATRLHAQTEESK